MTMRSGEWWRFSISSPRAERVFLVQRAGESVSRWIEMAKDAIGSWSVEHHLAPGHHRFHYFVVESGAYINCGTEGLYAERISEPDPTVLVAPLEMALSA